MFGNWYVYHGQRDSVKWLSDRQFLHGLAQEAVMLLVPSGPLYDLGKLSGLTAKGFCVPKVRCTSMQLALVLVLPLVSVMSFIFETWIPYSFRLSSS